MLLAAVLLSFALSCSKDDNSVEPEPNTVYGVVVDDEIGKPLPKVNISVGGLTTRTNGAGNYTITGLSKGTFTITATIGGYEDYTGQVTVDGRTMHNIFMQLQFEP